MADSRVDELTGMDQQVNNPAEERSLDEGVTGAREANGTPESRRAAGNWHAEAGRKGAERLRLLIQEGKLYEQEHGLTRGRQRIRQLIQEGKLYEKEHGLRPARARARRVSNDQLLTSFFHLLVRVARPNLRNRIARLVQALEQEMKEGAVDTGRPHEAEGK
jgi:hypothetical protein